MSTQNKIWIVPIEPIDQRYTKQWYDNIPEIIRIASDKYDIRTINGHGAVETTTKGAFLDFALTNAYKATQVEQVSQCFNDGLVKPGDKFLITDAWHFGIIAIKYMSELLDIPVDIHSIWHAGSYDPTDILGMKMSSDWPHFFETSVYHASDYNYFATNFHKNMFVDNLGITNAEKAIRSGQPHTPIIAKLLELSLNPRTDSVIFPHRLNIDKQPEIFANIRHEMDFYSGYDFIITQELNLDKDEYYKVLGSAKAVFSCALHENLGISVMEGCLAGAIPIVPDRASYTEMYLDCFKYPSEWTDSYDAYLQHVDEICNFIDDRVANYDKYYGSMMLQKNILIDKYLTATEMIDRLIR